ncbi:TetR/AcrR family transcriptional regulator [Aeromicrobium sp. Root495]|uniref:TetR/AcrR family transcriptional regulator n=1 Tax=Aeromicrobium sp. Root495 TaxID=1736550 RepID=UPI000A77636C|nr:TetR/AcrR family transcriptional regulator [Aeromicrobium sp. Root495]RYJ00624.1 MAG: TetR/AcrR family transcriptional regulator [Actinomycetales bacterium]
MARPVRSSADRVAAEAEQRSRILSALLECIEEIGYNATTMQEVAARARASKSVIYAHFDNKLDCFLVLYELVTRVELRVVAAAESRAVSAGLGWQARVRAMSLEFLELLARAPGMTTAVLLELPAAGPSALARRRVTMDLYLDSLSVIAEDMADSYPDEVRRVDRSWMLAALGGVNELVLEHIERFGPATVADIVDDVTRVFVEMLERR